jgi:hypothetical protein
MQAGVWSITMILFSHLVLLETPDLALAKPGYRQIAIGLFVGVVVV